MVCSPRSCTTLQLGAAELSRQASRRDPETAEDKKCDLSS